jgi:DNA repair and recombination RAD54-like protein
MASTRPREACAVSRFTPNAVFGTKDKFTKYYEGPILRGREPDATDKQKKLGKARQKELSDLSDHFIIRRMNRLNAEHLPPKLTQVVCCKLTPTQQRMYEHVVRKRDRVAATQGHVKDTLGVIQRLQKICNHPSLATQVDASASRVQRDDARELESLMPENDFAASAPRGRGGRIDHRYARMVDPALSGKLRVLHALMSELRRKGRERIVVVSVYMTTLDLIEQMCNQEDWPSCKLGGSTSTKKRKQFNDEFNDPTANYFAFLLSSKAGGCGLNLIGGSRLVMFDLDWNPATDKQAAARCWRDGQRYQCYTYRFVSSGTLEERMLQRQLSKEGLQNVIEDKDQARDAASTRRHAAATPSFDAGQLLRDRRPQEIIFISASYRLGLT